MTKELPRWRVSRLKGNRAAYLTTVSAKDAESAIAAIAKEYSITDPEQIKRLAARPAD